MYPCLIKARYWDEDKKQMVYGHLFMFADNFTEAANRAENFYDNIDELTIELFEADDVIEIGPMTAEHIRKGDKA